MSKKGKKPIFVEMDASTFKEYLLDRHREGSLAEHPELRQLLQVLLDRMQETVAYVTSQGWKIPPDSSLAWMTEFVERARPSPLDKAIALAYAIDSETCGQDQKVGDLLAILESMKATS